MNVRVPEKHVVGCYPANNVSFKRLTWWRSDIVAYGARELGRQTSKRSSPIEQTPPAQTGSREEGLNGLNK